MRNELSDLASGSIRPTQGLSPPAEDVALPRTRSGGGGIAEHQRGGSPHPCPLPARGRGTGRVHGARSRSTEMPKLSPHPRSVRHWCCLGSRGGAVARRSGSAGRGPQSDATLTQRKRPTWERTFVRHLAHAGAVPGSRLRCEVLSARASSFRAWALCLAPLTRHPSADNARRGFGARRTGGAWRMTAPLTIDGSDGRTAFCDRDQKSF